tara:strand:- start:10 stop:141 length:132 start_codon:yes stop_codon:yes gene_type:complete
LSKIGIKPGDQVVGKATIRTQKLIDDLIREINALKKRVTELES